MLDWAWVGVGIRGLLGVGLLGAWCIACNLQVPGCPDEFMRLQRSGALPVPSADGPAMLLLEHMREKVYVGGADRGKDKDDK